MALQASETCQSGATILLEYSYLPLLHTNTSLHFVLGPPGFSLCREALLGPKGATVTCKNSRPDPSFQLKQNCLILDKAASKTDLIRLEQPIM